MSLISTDKPRHLWLKNDGSKVTRIENEAGKPQTVLSQIVLTIKHNEIYADVEVCGYVPPHVRDQVAELVLQTNYLNLDLRNVIVRSVDVITAYSEPMWNEDKEKRRIT